VGLLTYILYTDPGAWNSSCLILVGLWISSHWPDGWLISTLSVHRCGVIGVFLFERCSDEREPSPGFLISFPVHYFHRVFPSGYHLWEPFSGIRFRLRMENFSMREAPPSHSYTRCSPSTVTTFPPHRLHGPGSLKLKRQVFAPVVLLPHTLQMFHELSRTRHPPFVANLLDPTRKRLTFRTTNGVFLPVLAPRRPPSLDYSPTDIGLISLIKMLIVRNKRLVCCRDFDIDVWWNLLTPHIVRRTEDQ